MTRKEPILKLELNKSFYTFTASPTKSNSLLVFTTYLCITFNPSLVTAVIKINCFKIEQKTRRI